MKPSERWNSSMKQAATWSFEVAANRLTIGERLAAERLLARLSQTFVERDIDHQFIG